MYAPPVPSVGAPPSPPAPPADPPAAIDEPATAPSVARTRAILDPRRILRWLYIGRLSLAAGIFAAAVSVWQVAEVSGTLIASLALAATMTVTGVSAWYSEIQRRPLVPTFFYLQAVFDLLLVTAVVHVTGGSASQFAALYILVIASASLLLPPGGGLLVAALGNVLYFADAILGHDTTLTLSVWLQLGVFAGVALGSGYLSARLQELGEGRAALAAELVQARLQAADILRNIRSGILTIDPGGRLLYANPAAGALLGLDVDAFLGKPVLPVIDRISPALARSMARAVHSGVRVSRQEAFVTTNGRQFPIGVATTYTGAGANAGPTSATAIFQDISDSKRLEELHLRTERLEAVAELSAALAHEIKNPLASIRSAVEQLARVVGASEDEQTLSRLVVRESDRLSRLLTEFLDFARVRVTRTERLDLAAVVRGAANLAAAHPDCKDGVRLSCHVPEQPVPVDGDEDLLHRAVFNLVLNAVQAVGAEGTVRVELAPVPQEQLPVGAAFDGSVVAIRVIDDGPGIAPEIHDRLFDPFVTTKVGGTGLGLPVVHRAIDAHRGLVFADSDEYGTRFTVLLPQFVTVEERAA